MPLPYTIDDSKEQWENIALMVPSKTIEELKKHYQLLVDDVTAIEYGYVPIPNYTVEENSHGYSRVLGADWQSNGNELPGTAQYQERRKGTPWTEEEHRHLGKRRLEKHIKELCDIEDTIPTRVSSLTTKLHLSLTHSDLKPVRPEEIQTPITSGSSQGSGEYFARLGIGQPTKEFYMAIDTGSDINWLQCEPCSECYQQTDPIFNPDDSSTYNRVTCDSPACSALDVSDCSTDTCQYQVSYGDGSFTVGELATETVSFGNSGSFSNVAIGCGHDNEGLFIGSAGLIGLGGGSLSFPSQIKASSFSYCLVDRNSDSSSTLEFNSAGPSDAVLAPLLRNSRRSTFFYVGVEGISVGGETLPIPANIFQVDETGHGGIIVDSGTAVTRLQTTVYNSLRDTFFKYAQNNLPSTDGFMLFDTCFDLSSMKTASVPTVAFHFSGGKKLSLHPKNTLVPVDSEGKYCLAFAPTDESLAIIGNLQQQGTRVSYDLTNNLVGFSPDKFQRPSVTFPETLGTKL
ncbi:hypothetical protein RND71_005310 [Anisodus tanguticus]|uniref:Peptidase A1 domain-containing protein n=1 Tax=Anisodus tanguticus TaxID=243964 RepID=A0AAE1VLD8_9SOLA|nr:hypothetical protein RND71_005310 [Anisodus tanguticus]